jgi:hypothetical protein
MGLVVPDRTTRLATHRELSAISTDGNNNDAPSAGRWPSSAGTIRKRFA